VGTSLRQQVWAGSDELAEGAIEIDQPCRAAEPVDDRRKPTADRARPDRPSRQIGIALPAARLFADRSDDRPRVDNQAVSTADLEVVHVPDARSSTR
jgi:hypothetical protein